MLKIYNTLTRQKETFKPIVDGKVGLYVCGMTVYDYCHIGHARVMVIFDIVARYFRHTGYELTYVRNVTDIDDKIINRANENSEDINALTERYIDAMHEDEQALNVLPPDLEPKATQSMDDIIKMILMLFEKGFAYTGTNGDVFYSVSKFTGYGQLSGKKLEELQAGERVDIDKAKKDPFDFVLWKKSKAGEPSWNSPWGRGRPGWHIECSAMSTSCLGNHFDIHGGGMDLQFPHHENEIAQSEGATGEKFVNLWMHNGFVRVDDEKMSKSLGNFFTVREVLKKYQPEVIRFLILYSHYRSPLNYSNESLDEARTSIVRLYNALRGIIPVGDIITIYQDRFNQAMDDDFNTVEAMAVLFKIANELNKAKQNDQDKVGPLAVTLKQLGSILGILQDDPDNFLKGKSITGDVKCKRSSNAEMELGSNDESIDKQIELRSEAKKNKDWVKADQIRDQLKQQGIILEDSPNGTAWRRQ